MASDPRRRLMAAASAVAATPENAESSAGFPPPPPPPQQFQAPPMPPTNSQPILFSGKDEDEEEDRDVDMDVSLFGNNNTSSDGVSTAAYGVSLQLPMELISTSIITPSPFAHHNTGSRFRNALSRITNDPTGDVEAWQALLTEVTACIRSITNVHAVDADTQSKLDWIESCYGCLLHYFPYASFHYVTICELLLAQSARVGEEQGPLTDYGHSGALLQRSMKCEAKVETIFQKVLGIKSPDGENKVGIEQDSITSGMCTSCVELWLLYIRKRARDATRQANSTIPSQSDRAPFIRKATMEAYELAIEQAGFVLNNHILWKQYLQFVKGWVDTADVKAANTDHVLQQQQMIQLRSIYQRLVTHPMTGLDQLWQEYEAFERSQSEALAAALVSEYTPKYQHARTVYLERNRMYSIADLQLTTKFATPPMTNKSTTDEDKAETFAKFQEEQRFVTLWKTRIAYERTNPERVAKGSNELTQRVRQAFKEMACVLTRHIEVWHMWSMWELLLSSPKPNANNAIAVLELGQTHIPDSTLLAYEQAKIAESHTPTPESCFQPMERILQRAPTTLGFVLYQQMVRRYKGKQAARNVFLRARQVLRHVDTPLNSVPEPISTKNAVDTGSGTTTEATTTGADGTIKQEAASTDQQNQQQQEETPTPATDATSSTSEKMNGRGMVTNRLPPSIGILLGKDTNSANKNSTIKMKGDSIDTHQHHQQQQQQQQPSERIGPITWQLYASHATMEHRLNGHADVAARVYELGLRKHSSFLTKPPYVLQYAQLLLELRDSINLRALLTRAVTACENNTDDKNRQHKLAALWDMTLRFESVMSGADPANVPILESVERQRRAALLGADIEDVTVGGMRDAANAGTTIGAQKSTISEQLIRSDGYDTCSKIINGMSRALDVLEVMGLWGSSSMSSSIRFHSTLQLMEDDNDETNMPGGASDASYQRRLQFLQMGGDGSTGMIMNTMMMDQGTNNPNKFLSARERLQGPQMQQQQQQMQQGGGGASASSAIIMAIQQSPEWIRPLLMMLPASKIRTPLITKPPPHITEMALTALRQHNLPAERPQDENTSASDTKRKRNNNDGDDSSDDENDTAAGGGYGSQFRARQRARMAAAASGMTNGAASTAT